MYRSSAIATMITGTIMIRIRTDIAHHCGPRVAFWAATWRGIVCEWAPDFTSDERHKVNPAVMKNGAGVGLALEQIFAQS